MDTYVIFLHLYINVMKRFSIQSPWDNKHAEINVILSEVNNNAEPFLLDAFFYKKFCYTESKTGSPLFRHKEFRSRGKTPLKIIK